VREFPKFMEVSMKWYRLFFPQLIGPIRGCSGDFDKTFM